MQHVYWIGGGSGAGKSAVARLLADRCGLRLYATDDVMGDHAARAPAAGAPMLEAFRAMSMDERWLLRSPGEMLRSFHWYRGEAFELILEDLRRLPDGPGVVVEGFRLLPSLVAPHAAPGHAVWLLPTPDFRRTAFERRGALWTIAGKTSDPQRALHNLLERDRMFTDRLRAAVAALGLPAIEIDGTEDLDAVAARVRETFTAAPRSPGDIC
ncbi:hypothetical protein [Dactylosporangium sp. CS-033363]|uniref:hypothetical protein n=1 Tax=Dactylosporangium sp. CS-033363 TaxID=3239935 RepID=UPI003D92FDB4